MREVLAEVRYAARRLVSTPGMTAAAVLTLALGIGANSAVFSLADATLLRPLHVADPDRLFALSWSSSYPDYRHYASKQEVFGGVMAWSGDRVNLGIDGASEIAGAAFVSGNTFEVLGVPAAIGRTLRPEDDVVNGPIVAVLSHEYWQRRFGGDQRVLGAVIRVNERPATIVGVARAGFRGTSLYSNPRLYLPLTAVGQTSTGFMSRVPIFTSSGFVWLTVIGRLADGAAPDQASAWVNTTYRQLHPPRPGEAPEPLPPLTPLRVRALGGTSAATLERFVLLLAGVTGITLLIGCANLANLLFARAAARTREVAVRLALGAGRRRVVLQMLIEGVLLTASGGILGVGVAVLGLRLLAAYQLPGGVNIETLALGVDVRTLAATAAIAMLTALAFGTAPAWRASRVRILDSLRDDTRVGTTKSLFRSTLVASQMALCLLLLAGSGLFLKSLIRALGAPRGFDVEGVATASVNAGLARYDEVRAIELYRAALDEVRQLHGVTAAAWSHLVPVKGLMMWDAEIEGYRKGAEEDITLYASHVGPDYFRAAGTRLVAGRPFAATDTATAPRVAIVNQALADRYFGARGALGGRIKPFRGDWVTVVGIAENTTVRQLGERPLPYIYLAFDQTLAGPGGSARDPAHLFVRTSGDVEALLPRLRERLLSLDPALPVYDVQPFAFHVRELIMPQQLGFTLLACFSTLALALATVGLYGVSSYVSALRTREIGIRVALGADATAVKRLIVGQAILPIASGIGAGCVLAAWAGRLATTLLFDTSPGDPAIFTAVAAMLGGLALAAAYVPARRAARLDPVTALRYE